MFRHEALDEYLSGWRPGRTSVRVGEPYLHPDLVDVDADVAVAEFPPIERELDVSVLETVERGKGAARLTERSVALVRDAVRERLDAERRTALAAAGRTAEPGVDSGRVYTRPRLVGTASCCQMYDCFCER